jgi:hypothetical protein
VGDVWAKLQKLRYQTLNELVSVREASLFRLIEQPFGDPAHAFVGFSLSRPQRLRMLWARSNGPKAFEPGRVYCRCGLRFGGSVPVTAHTMRRLIARALWQQQDPIVHGRTDLGRDSNRCAPIRGYRLAVHLRAHAAGQALQKNCKDTRAPTRHGAPNGWIASQARNARY